MSKKPTPKKDAITSLVTAMAGQQNVIVVNRFFVDLTGTLEAAILLSQIIYWSDRATMADGWFAKTYDDWRDEICLSKYQVNKGTKTLVDFGVETKIKKFNGSPTVHYHLDMEQLSQSIVKFLTFDSEETSQSITETTTETIVPKGTSAPVSTDEIPKPKRSEKQLANDAMVEALGKAYDIEASNGEYGMYLKIAKKLTKDITSEQFTDYVEFVRAMAKRDGWTFTIHSLTSEKICPMSQFLAQVLTSAPQEREGFPAYVPPGGYTLD